MADPITVLGAVSAASQLADQGLKITIFLCQLGSQIRGARKSTHKRVEQVEQLVSIAKQIISNPSLQTDTMASILQTGLMEIRKLEKLLRNLVISAKHSTPVKLIRSLKAAMKEKEINSYFDNIERIKGLLSLCMSEMICTNMRTSSQDVLASLQKIHPIVSTTSTNMSIVANSLPTILEHLEVIDQELCNLHNQDDSRLDSASKMRLDSLMQRLMLCQRNLGLYRHFGTNMFTHYQFPPRGTKILCAFNSTITTLKQNFSHRSRPGKMIVNLAGVSCGGKSQVAIEFCHQARMDQQFGAIFWIKASSATLIRKGFKSIADTFSIPKSDPPESRLKTSLSILPAWPCPWLLVFDNYGGDDVDRDIGPYMPEGAQASYLITRRCSNSESMRRSEKEGTVYLPDLRLQDAVDILLARGGMSHTDENYEQGVRLAMALKKIPRAIIDAAKYIKKHNITIAEYLKMFQEGDTRTVAKFFDELRIRRGL